LFKKKGRERSCDFAGTLFFFLFVRNVNVSRVYTSQNLCGLVTSWTKIKDKKKQIKGERKKREIKTKNCENLEIWVSFSRNV